MNEKRFRVTVVRNNSVELWDVVDNARLLLFQFSNKRDALSCQDALLHQCNMMNAIYEENEQLKSDVEYWKQEALKNAKIIEKNIDVIE